MSKQNVILTKVQNSNEPWKEICKHSELHERECNFIVVEPMLGCDPLNSREPSYVFNIESTMEIDDNIYGSYDVEQLTIDENDSEPSILKISVACLKNSSTLKHAHMSTYIAMTDLFHSINKFNLRESHYIPDVILNTNCNINLIKLSNFSEIVREITAAYINHYDAYPNIFVAFSDDTPLTEENDYKKKKSKKNKKKKNKKKGNK